MNRLTSTLATLLCCAATAVAGVTAERVDYLKDIKPVLAARCYACHGALKQKAGLRLDTAAAIRKGGENGPAIVASKPEKSRLLKRVTAKDEDDRMPPEGEPLTSEQIAKLTEWLKQGASAPATEKADEDPGKHWAFIAPVRSAVPGSSKLKVKSPNPIDAFLAVEHEKHGLTPQPPADQAVLLRRVYLDLIGLPPTRAELAVFLADPARDAYEKVVDRLLATPQYGERWGRHWMDVWRYSDWYGLGAQLRNSQKPIWHWRDWIIESLNSDKGYDRMIREMLAGDEIAPTDPEVLRATGFLARNYFLFNRNTWLDETVEHTSKAFLGVTLNCAKCHDHKYDPFAQTDYYRFRAFFEPHQVRLDALPGETDLEKDGLPRVFDLHADAPTWLLVRGDEKQPDKTKPITPGLPAVWWRGEMEIKPVALPLESFAPALRPAVQADLVRQAEQQITAARDALAKVKKAPTASPTNSVEGAQFAVELAEKALATAELRPASVRAALAADTARWQNPPATNAKELAQAAALAEKKLAAAKTEEDLLRAEQDLQRGNTGKHKKDAPSEKKVADAKVALEKARQAVESPGESYTSPRASRKAFEGPTETEAMLPAVFPATSTGRRTALANWIASRQNPLTARVAVNQMWSRHFGEPLAPTVFDLGRKSALPTHPALLDWLAVEFMEHGWSMKHLHRLMVTSAAYRRASSVAADMRVLTSNSKPETGKPKRSQRLLPSAATPVTIDPDNRFLWRMNARRMESQVVRDSLLFLSGELDLKVGGPTLDPRADTSLRRSLYFTHSQEDQNRFLAMFDDAKVLECYRRQESIVPQQALAMANSKLGLSVAPKIVARLEAQLGGGTDAAFVRAAFEAILATPPTSTEQSECEQALAAFAKLQEGKKVSPQRARANLVHALLNHNDFVTIR